MNHDNGMHIGITGGPLSPEEKYGKILILGRAQTGKSTMAQKLSDATGLSVLKTCTTRPRRHPDEDTYHFYAPEDAAAIPEDEKLFRTMAVDGFERWTNRSDFLSAGIAVLDATALVPAVKLWQAQGYRVCVLYLKDDKPIRKTRWMKTMAGDDGSGWDDAILKFEHREAIEAPMFDAMEQDIMPVAIAHPDDLARDPRQRLGKCNLVGEDGFALFDSHGRDSQEDFLPGFIEGLAAGARPAGGYRKDRSREDLVLEPEDWTETEWRVICRLLGLVPENTMRAVIKTPVVEYFSDPKNQNAYKEVPR